MISVSTASNKKKIVWVEKTGLLEVFLLILESMFYDIKVYYDEHHINNIAHIFIKLTEKLNRFKFFFPANLSFDLKDTQGYSLTYQAQKILDICLEGFCSKYIPDEYGWYKRMIKSYIAGCIYKRIKFIIMVEANIAERNHVQHELLLARHPGNSLIINFYQESAFDIRQTFSITEYLKIILKPLINIIINLVFRKYQGEVRSNITNTKPSVWVEAHLEMFEGRSDLSFWRKHLKAKQFDIVYYFDQPDKQCEENSINIIRKRGEKYIDCQNIAKLSRLDFKCISKLILLLIQLNVKQPLWFHFVKVQYAVLYKMFYSIYKSFQVKIIIQHKELIWKQSVQAKAIEDAGGIMIGFHWSVFNCTTEPQHITPQHVYFVWGQINYEWLKKKGNTCRHILPSGIWFLATEDNQLELNCLRNSSEFVLAIFDNVPGYNKHVSPNNVSSFYLDILKLLENNRRWGGIVKSKNYELEGLWFLPNGNEIVKKIEGLIDQKRLVYLKPFVSPITASSYADLSVCSIIESAGIIAGEFGYKAIHFDVGGFLGFPIYKDPGQKIIYRSQEEVEQAIIKASEGDQSIGDFSRWKMKFNYFNDFKASERIAQFIQNYMDKIIETGDALHSLDLAAKRYIYENKVKDDFFKIEDLWGDK